MSWVVEEWKEGLSTRVLHKIQELESQLEKLKKERQQRQFQLESLEAALQKQKQKVEHEKNEGATQKRENQNLMELCDNLEKTRQKLSHDLQVKESQVNFQEGQLISSRKQIESLEQELKRYKSELERNQPTLVTGELSFSNTPQKNFSAPSTPSYNESKFEELQVKYNKEVEERKKLVAELKSVMSQKSNPSHPQSTMSRKEIARQQASSSVFLWQQEKTPSHPSSVNQKTPLSNGSITSHCSWELRDTPSRQQLKSVERDSSNRVLRSCKDSPLIDPMKIQNQDLRTKVQELEHSLQIQTKEMKFQVTKLHENQLQLEKVKTELTEKDKALKRSGNEIIRLATKLDQTTNQFSATEEKMKRLSDELNCQRQNSESARRSLEQKLKENEKEYQKELSRQLDQVKTMLQDELYQAKNDCKHLHAELEKTLSAKQQLEKEASDYTHKLSRADQAVQTMQEKENELRRNVEEVQEQNSHLRCQAAQQLQDICQLKEGLCEAKRLLQQNQNLVEEMKKKNWCLENELKQLKEKLNMQENSLTVEQMKLALSDLENQRDSSRQLLKEKEDIIEKLNIKLEDLEASRKVLGLKEAECDGLKKEIEILSLWKKESEPVLNKLGSEEEELISKITDLENSLMTEQIKSNDRVRSVEAENENLCKEIKNLKCTVESIELQLEAQQIAYDELQQKTATTEEKYRKERENNAVKSLEFSNQVGVLQETLQSTANEVLEKKKCISALEASLASHVQVNASFRKQVEELIEAKEEAERELAGVQQRYKEFARESEQHVTKLEEVISEKQGLVNKASATLEERDKHLELLIKESERQHATIQDLKVDKEFLLDSLQQLQNLSQAASQKEADLSAAIILNKKDSERLEEENSVLKSTIGILEQKNLDLMQTNLQLSNCLKEQEENLSELSERQKEKSWLLSEAGKELEELRLSLEAKDANVEGALREQACHFEGETTRLESREKQLTNDIEALRSKLPSSEEKNKSLLQQLEKMPPTTQDEVSPIQNALLDQPDCLGKGKAAQNKMMLQHPAVPLQENEWLMADEATGDFTSWEQLKLSLKVKEDELNKYQVKLELLQMDLEDKEASVKHYADQLKVLETVLSTAEIKVEASEKENKRLKRELQTLKDVANSTSEITEEDGTEQSAVLFNAVTKDNFNQRLDAKCSSAPHDLSPSQNDYVPLVSSLYMTMSKLNELEKMCEHLQIEKSTLASQLKESQLGCVISTYAMAEELTGKIHVVKEESAAFSDELMGQSKTQTKSDIGQMPLIALACGTELDYEDLKLSSKKMTSHFDEVKGKICSLKNEYEILHGQNLSMASKISELQCCVEMLQEENSALSTSLSQVSAISFITPITPRQRDKEFQAGQKLCRCHPCCCEDPPCTKASCVTPDCDKDQYRPSNEKAELSSSSNQTDLGSRPDDPNSFSKLDESDLSIFTVKHGQVIPQNYTLENKVAQHLLCETYEKSFKKLEESFESHKNLEDQEIQKIQALLLSARKEVDCLRKQTLSDSEQWQRQLHHVILKVASKLPTEHLSQELEEPKLHRQGYSQTQILAEQANDALNQMEKYGLSHESLELERVNDIGITRTLKAYRTEDEAPDGETVMGIKSTDGCFQILVPDSGNASDISPSPSDFSIEVLPNYNGNVLGNHRVNEIPPLQLKQACWQSAEPSHNVEESNTKMDALLIEVQSLNSSLVSKNQELAAQRIACADLDETVVALKKENQELSETLTSVNFENQQLSYNLVILEMELKRVRSDLEMHQVRLSDTTETLEDLETAQTDWNEKFLEMENELRRIKSERENVESHALAMEADIEELQSKNELLEKENENKLKTISGLQEQLCLTAAERNQFSQDLSDLSKYKEETEQMCQKMQETIKELESSKADSAEFIKILEAEAKTQTKLLQTVKANADQLSTEKECLVLQLHNLEMVTRDLTLEKEAAQNQIEHVKEEKEEILGEHETLQTKLRAYEMEMSKISKCLEGSLIEKGELAARLNSAQEEVEQMREGIEKLKKKIESDEKRRCRLVEKLRDTERRADFLADKTENLERELQMAEENLEDAIIQTEGTKAEMEVVNAEMEKMCMNVRNLECETNALKCKKECLERELKEQQTKVLELESSNSTFVEQLKESEEEKLKIKGQCEYTLMLIQSQLREAQEEIKMLSNEQDNCKAKGQVLMIEIASLKQENAQLVYCLKETNDKNLETWQLMETLIQELQDISHERDKNDSFLEQLSKNKTWQSTLEHMQVSCSHSEEELGARASENYTFSEKAASLKQAENSFHHKFQQWKKFCRELKQEKELMVKRVYELEAQLKMADPSFHTDAASEEIKLELEGLRELVEEKTREADQSLEKYCALIIDHNKLEEENEMLKTQVCLLNTQIKALSSNDDSSWQSSRSSTEATGRLFREQNTLEDVAEIPAARRQQGQENRGGGKGVADSPVENKSPCISPRMDVIPRMSSCPVSTDLSSPPSPPDHLQIFDTGFLENPKETAEGSKLQKIYVAHQQEMHASGSTLGFTVRSPLSACNLPTTQPDAGRSAECLDKTRHSKSTEENELEEACHVQ